ncbi:heat shock 70 kDa protein-like isoform X2 [Aethina tumida]|uniref:heat shock 70 kDa protein-like isoform X2 n=1 Tax=Aethina tumida TaxID=116153 RepID=UPI00096AE208|nr:heat shock 70 kDa protein-like isoform X2 [Aethina tumida]
MSNKEELYIGIDLGLTKSCLAVYDGKTVNIIETHCGKTTPSQVYYDPNPKVGTINTQTENKIYDVLRFIGRKSTDELVQSIYKTYPFAVMAEKNSLVFQIPQGKDTLIKTPQEVISDILKYFKERLKSEYDFNVLKSVIAIPASFNTDQRMAIMEAAKMADIEVLKLINATTAAAIFCSNEKQGKDRTICIVDFGGGSFEVCLTDIKGNNLLVRCTYSDSSLGGSDVDNALFNYVVSRLKKKVTDIDIDSLRIKCKEAKEELSSKSSAVIVINKNKVEIKKKDLNKLMKCMFNKCKNIIESCLKEGNVLKKEIQEVVLIGGSTKLQKFQKLATKLFDESKIFTGVNSDFAVAGGAAIQAWKDQSPLQRTLQIKDVIPYSIGVADCLNGMSWGIKANTQLPAQGTIEYLTSYNDQKTLKLLIYKGRWFYNNANDFVGSLTLAHLPPRPGLEIKVIIDFHVSENRILTVEAKIAELNMTSKMKYVLHGQNEPETSHWNPDKDMLFAKAWILKYWTVMLCHEYMDQESSGVKLPKSTRQCEELIDEFHSNDEYLDPKDVIKQIKKFIEDFVGDFNADLMKALRKFCTVINLDHDALYDLCESFSKGQSYEIDELKVSIKDSEN